MLMICEAFSGIGNCGQQQPGELGDHRRTHVETNGDDNGPNDNHTML